MEDDFSFKIVGLFKKPYKFTAYDPYLTHINGGNVFVDPAGNPLNKNDFQENLFSMGERAFKLLEIESEVHFQELCKGYFHFIYLMTSLALEMHEDGRLEIKYGKLPELDGVKFIKDVLEIPSRDKLRHLAPTIIKLSLSLGNEINVSQKETDDVDILNDVFIASLIHTLIAVDEAIFLLDIETMDALNEVETATRVYSIAESILENKEMQKKIRIKKAKFAAKKRHEKTDIAKKKIREIWASGKYRSRDICAEQEAAALNISFSTARKALRNTHDAS